MSSELTMVIFTASASSHKNLLTTHRALSARVPLVGLFLLMFCATQLKLELSAMTNSHSLRTLTNALSNSQQPTRQAAVQSRNLASSNY
jgi:hypothetical protein